MDKPKNLDDFIRIHSKLNSHLPVDGSEEIIILKGHLLLEEMLREILGKSVISQESVDAAQLSFHQVVCIVRSMYTNKANEWVWLGIVEINKIRNKMAHNLKPVNLNEKCESLIEHSRRFGVGNVRLCVLPTE